MDRNELLALVREAEKIAKRKKVAGAMKEKLQAVYPDQWQKFLLLRVEADQLGDELETATLDDLATRLESLSGQLKDAVADLKKSIKDMDDAVAVVNLLSRVLALAAKVAVLV